MSAASSPQPPLPSVGDPSPTTGYPEGRVRGSLLRGWAENIERRSGREGLQRVRDALPEGTDPGRRIAADAWLPVATQLAITEAVIARLLDGNPDAFAAVLDDDVRRSVGRAQRAVLRMAGPERILRRSPTLFGHAYDVGRLRVDALGPKNAVLRYDSAPLVAHPTWRCLQRWGWECVIGLTGRTTRVAGHEDGDAWVLSLDW